MESSNSWFPVEIFLNSTRFLFLLLWYLYYSVHYSMFVCLFLIFYQYHLHLSYYVLLIISLVATFCFWWVLTSCCVCDWDIGNEVTTNGQEKCLLLDSIWLCGKFVFMVFLLFNYMLILLEFNKVMFHNFHSNGVFLAIFSPAWSWFFYCTLLFHYCELNSCQFWSEWRDA